MAESKGTLKEALNAQLQKLLQLPGFTQLIPEVGSNFVACLPGASKIEQVAGLTGRIILVRGKPHAVGEVDFGWAPFMGRVILKAHQLNPSIHAAISLRNTSLIVEGSRRAGLQVIGFRLPPSQPIPDCMTLTALEKLRFVPEVLFDWGALGVEPLIVVFGKTPKEVTTRVERILSELSVQE
ncbi:MAG: thiamine-phosphate synthase family protein [Candidatus Hodarchaeota archaeon]